MDEKIKLNKTVEFETTIWKMGERYVIPIEKELADDYDLTKVTVKITMTPKSNYVVVPNAVEPLAV